MTSGRRVAVGFMLLWIVALTLGLVDRARAGVANPPNIPVPENPRGWCTATLLAPGTTRTTQIGDCPAPPPDTCPAGRQTVAQVCYRYGPSDCINTDVTKFENIWGRGRASDTPTPFPGLQVFAIIKTMQKSQYIAAKFVAPLSPLNAYGLMNHASTTPGPNLTGSISTRCGDFLPPSNMCRATNVGVGINMLPWKLPGYPGPALCPLTPGHTYYLNLKMTDPPAYHFDCTSSYCRVNIQNNHNP